MSPSEIFHGVSWTGLGVMIVLLMMSIYSIAIMLERYLTFTQAANRELTISCI